MFCLETEIIHPRKKKDAMNSQDIRRAYLQYFKDQKHSIVPSSPVVPHDDPTLLFNNAGMNQFKDVFLGSSAREYTRATSSQKCIRVGGKHNDLDNVGHTKRHLTFFEMMGNFSFGDYFKEETIRFAWDVSTEVFKLDPERIYASVFLDDDEAFELWLKYLPENRIVRFGEKENFWAMGDVGPCGPCSELLFDRGEKYGSAETPYDDADGERYLEYWNLVFMQYNRDAAGQMPPLPKQSIDTGAGLERVVSLQMDVENVFQTDVLRNIIAQVEEESGVKYNLRDTTLAPAFHVIADHLRMLSFAIADGAQPSNVDRGYVLRKVLRRAVRYGRMLGFEKPFLAKVFPRLENMMGEDFPELKTARARIEEVLSIEEEAFFRTLRRGGNILNNIIEKAQKSSHTINGDDAFKLKDTYGFPFEEILLIAKDTDLKVDVERYNTLEEEAREKSRSAHKGTRQEVEENLFVGYTEEHGECQFVGYTEDVIESEVKALVVEGEFVEALHTGQQGLVILAMTPFYAEMGGQVGDKGSLEHPMAAFTVEDCQQPYPGVIVHEGTLDHGVLSVGDAVTASIDKDRRRNISNNHTATHILHWALSQVLGEHVRQAGSVVDIDKLRFDFSHHKALSLQEVRDVEDCVNAKIRENLAVEAYEMSHEESQKDQGIKQFFGDKYGAKVRVVDIEESKELCGGTHTSTLGAIGYFRIAKEGSIAAGIRRIEGVTGYEAEVFAQKSDDTIEEAASLLKTHSNLMLERIQGLLDENKKLIDSQKEAQKAEMGTMVDDLLKKVVDVKGIPVLFGQVSVEAGQLRSLSNDLMVKIKTGVVCLATSTAPAKCNLIVNVSPGFIQKVKANDIIKEVAPIVGGGGGGKADIAQAGGTAPEKIGEALNKIRQIFEEL
jgi:alanyl-tRNA synthetase